MLYSGRDELRTEERSSGNQVGFPDSVAIPFGRFHEEPRMKAHVEGTGVSIIKKLEYQEG